jgi:hypothetical protein
VEGILQDIYGSNLGSQNIILSYTFAGIGIWTPITSATTDSLGNYDTVWFPPATGYYLLKVEWGGDTLYLGTNNTIAVSTMPVENQYVFTVESNSTVTSLNFDTASRSFNFVVSGESGATIAKSLASNIGDIKVYVNETETQFTSTSTSDSWIIYLTYNQSTHKLMITLGLASFIDSNLGRALLYGIPIVIVTVLAAVYLVKKKRTK